MVLSSAIVCDHDRRIAGDRRSVFPYDRRRSQNFLRSAICDPRSSAIIWKPALNMIMLTFAETDARIARRLQLIVFLFFGMFMCAKLHVCKYMFRIKGQYGIPGLINMVCCYPTKEFDIYTHVIC